MERRMLLNRGCKEDEAVPPNPFCGWFHGLLSSVRTCVVFAGESSEIHDISLSWLTSPCSKVYLSSIGCLLYTAPRDNHKNPPTTVPKHSQHNFSCWCGQNDVCQSLSLDHFWTVLPTCKNSRGFLPLSPYTLVVPEYIVAGFSSSASSKPNETLFNQCGIFKWTRYRSI